MMKDFSAIKLYFSKTIIITLLLISFLLLYPYELKISGITLVNNFIKTRVISLGILFLVLRGLIHDYYSPRLLIIFLVMLILSPSVSFGYLVIGTLVLLIIFRIFRKI